MSMVYPVCEAIISCTFLRIAAESIPAAGGAEGPGAAVSLTAVAGISRGLTAGAAGSLSMQRVLFIIFSWGFVIPVILCSHAV